MKLDKPENENYSAVVVEIKTLVPLANMDNVVAFPILGYQALVGKEARIGDVGVLFVAESELSDDYLRVNNLYRHADKNLDPTASGYIEDNRRVKAIKLRGNRSDALFMPLESVAPFLKDGDDLKVGDVFDKLNGTEIVRKYVKWTPEPRDPQARKVARAFRRVTEALFPAHLDTDNWWRNEHTVGEDETVIITQKVHGTSVRIGRVPVKRELKWYEKALKKVGVQISAQAYDNVYGSRKVIKDVNNPAQVHYYAATGEGDLWTREGRKLDGLLPDNFIVYGELIGWASPDTPIQANYTYDVPQGEAHLYVYRVAIVLGENRMVDLSWDQVKEWTASVGLRHVPELWRGPKHMFDADEWIDLRFADVTDEWDHSYFTETPILLSGSKKLVDEGVVVRAEGMTPRLYKAKSPIFLQHETSMLDTDAVDLEAEESVPVGG